MLTLARLRLYSWKCYAGETVLELEPKPYGIFARDADDSDKSNWLGKSSLTEAVDFALTGRLPRDARLKTDWITRGEARGEVELGFSDGSRVMRSQLRSGSEKLHYFPPGEKTNAAVQERAQEAIDRLLGLTRDDVSTWCFRQGEMSGLLKMDPGPRLALFTDWIRLEKLEECQGIAADARAEIEKRLEEKRRELDAVGAAAKFALERVGIASPEGFPDAIRAAQADVAISALEVEKMRESDALVRERDALLADARRFDQIVEEGKRLAGQLASLPADDVLREAFEARRRESNALDAERMKKARELADAEGVSRGVFSGTCPVVNSPCPSAAFVREEGIRKSARLIALRDEMRALETAWRAALESESKAGAEREYRGQLTRRVETLRAAAKPLVARKKRWEDLRDAAPPPMHQQADADQALAHDEQRLAALQSALGQVSEAEQRTAVLQEELRGLEKLAAVPSAAAVVFEKARKQIAEGVLSEIEGHANDLLALIGPDLSVEVSWGREGAGLASACSRCGASFPASRKVKACSRCGAERGQQVQERLDLIPSRRSGAADDLASVALSLGASRWLREERGSQWGTATIDEVTAQLDAANRAALAAKLPEVLRFAGFAQAFVTSHHAGVLESLPGRIEIVSRGGVSTVRVVA